MCSSSRYIKLILAIYFKVLLERKGRHTTIKIYVEHNENPNEIFFLEIAILF